MKEKTVAPQAYQPEIVCEDISKLAQAAWEALRNLGIGGSDTGAILGIFPWKTILELFWEKLGQLPPREDDDASWLAKETGHVLEAVVAELFARLNPDWEVYNDTRMFRHPVYKFMLADLDRVIVNKRTGQVAILEIKTCDPHTLDHWGGVNDNVVPPYYESQGRHYMAVTGLDMVVYAVLAGTRESGYRQRVITRDMEKEAALIEAERDFWENHVVPGIPPEAGADGNAKAVIDALGRKNPATGKTEEIAPELADSARAVVEADRRIKALKKELSDAEAEKDRAMAPIVESLKGSAGHISLDGGDFTLKPVTRETTRVASGDIPPLLLAFPDAESFVSKSSSVSWKTGFKEAE